MGGISAAALFRSRRAEEELSVRVSLVRDTAFLSCLPVALELLLQR